jgi:hypothetical protein
MAMDLEFVVVLQWVALRWERVEGAMLWVMLMAMGLEFIVGLQWEQVVGVAGAGLLVTLMAVDLEFIVLL